MRILLRMNKNKVFLFTCLLFLLLFICTCVETITCDGMRSWEQWENGTKELLIHIDVHRINIYRKANIWLPDLENPERMQVFFRYFTPKNFIFWHYTNVKEEKFFCSISEKFISSNKTFFVSFYSLHSAHLF